MLSFALHEIQSAEYKSVGRHWAYTRPTDGCRESGKNHNVQPMAKNALWNRTVYETKNNLESVILTTEMHYHLYFYYFLETTKFDMTREKKYRSPLVTFMGSAKPMDHTKGQGRQHVDCPLANAIKLIVLVFFELKWPFHPRYESIVVRNVWVCSSFELLDNYDPIRS
jgi:hypothetical protein